MVHTLIAIQPLYCRMSKFTAPLMPCTTAYSNCLRTVLKQENFKENFIRVSEEQPDAPFGKGMSVPSALLSVFLELECRQPPRMGEGLSGYPMLIWITEN